MFSRPTAVLLLVAVLLPSMPSYSKTGWVTSQLVHATEPTQRNIAVYKTDYPGTYGQIYSYFSTDTDSVGSGYSRVDSSNVENGVPSCVRGYTTEYEDVTRGIWPNKRVLEGGYERRLRICSVRQHASGTIQTFHVLYIGECTELSQWTSGSASESFQTLDSIWVSHRPRTVEGNTQRFHATVCRGYNDFIYSTLSSSGGFCSNQDNVLLGFEFHAFGEPTQRSIVVYKADFPGTYGQVYGYFSNGTDSVGSGYSRVDGANVDNGVPSYVRGYSIEYEAVTRGIWPNKRVLAGGYERRLRICSVRQHASGIYQTFHVLYIGECTELSQWTSGSASESFQTLDSIWVSHMPRTVEGNTQRFHATVCRGYNDFIYSTLSSFGGFCSNQGNALLGFEFHAFGGGVGGSACEPPSNPAFGLVTGTDFRHGHGIEYQCASGYSMIGGPTAFCQSNGEWSAMAPTCQEINCPDPGIPEHGQRIGEDFSCHSVLQFTCEDGYGITGSSIIICEETGVWSDSTPRCHAVACPPLPPLSNGVRVGEGSHVGMIINFRCLPGFELHGTSSTTCLSSQQWSTSVTSCEPCGIGFYKVTMDSSACIPCPAFSTTLAQASSIIADCICQAGTDRSEDGLSCEEIQCHDPGVPEHGQRIGDDFTRHSVIQFTCDAGYTITGSNTIVCDETGVWSDRRPICHEIGCREPCVPEHGQRHGAEFHYHSVVQFTCDEGYVIDGSNTIVCTESGVWSHRSPRCQAVTCPPLSSPTNGILLGESFHYGVTVVFLCNPGFELVGDHATTCLSSRQWSTSVPSCQPVTCPPLTPFANGMRVGDVFEYGETVDFLCFPGFELVGDRSTTCLASRQWSHSVPSCMPCGIGFYKAGMDGNVCVPCPEFSTTFAPASSTIHHCICQAGTERTEDGQRCEATTV